MTGKEMIKEIEGIQKTVDELYKLLESLSGDTTNMDTALKKLKQCIKSELNL